MTTSKKNAATTTDAPRVMPSKYKSWLIEYMKVYHPEAEFTLETNIFIAFSTELFKYHITYYKQADFAEFDLLPAENGSSIFYFPMPPTYVDFVDVMKILDVK